MSCLKYAKLQKAWELVNFLSKFARVVRSLKVRLHVRSCDREVCLFYYVQIAIDDFYYAQLCAKLRECAHAI